MKRKAIAVVDLGFGDAGKGTMVDFFARTRTVSAVVRFNGGAQAGHNVVTPDGRHHTFVQWGSGTFVPGVRTHFSAFMLVDPYMLALEEAALREVGIPQPYALLSVDRGARIVTPFHKAGNRLRESLRGSGKHGSVGMGIGETMYDDIVFSRDTVYAADLREPEALEEKLRRVQERKREEFSPRRSFLQEIPYLANELRLLFDPHAPRFVARDIWEGAMRYKIVPSSYLAHLAEEGDLVFEGAQGVLLDEWYGFHPYTTWSTTTFANVDTILREIGYQYPVERVGVVRTFATRHGAGPLPTDDPMLLGPFFDPYNTTRRWQDDFRVGWLDAVLTRYAIAVAGGVDHLALTHCDTIATVRAPKLAVGYTMLDAQHLLRDRPFVSLGSEEGSTVVTGLRPKTTLTDLMYQSRLTEMLAGVRPVLRSLPSESSLLVSFLEKELGVPIRYTSFGPTAHEKRVQEEHAAALLVS